VTSKFSSLRSVRENFSVAPQYPFRELEKEEFFLVPVRHNDDVRKRTVERRLRGILASMIIVGKFSFKIVFKGVEVRRIK